MRAQFRGAIQTDFPDVLRLWKQAFEKGEFGVTLMRDLRMKPKGGLDPLLARCQPRRASPGLWCGRNRKHVMPLHHAFRDDGRWIAIEIKMAMEVDHTATPDALR